MTIGCPYSCPVCVELDTFEATTIVLGGDDMATKLDCSKVTLGGVVKAAAHIAGCPPPFCFESEFWFVKLILMFLLDLRFIRQV